jgi:tRNA pseudouridine13 synthase
MALTRQWFSVPALEPERALDLELRGARVLSATRHGHKLRTGQLRANRFAICVREVGADVVERAQRALDEIVRVGFPNRFGSQRFGREGDNATAALALLRGKAPRGERRAARFLISALQAAVFNEVLAQRPLSLDRVEVGDLAVVNASGGLFLVEDAERENARAGSFEISATGPIFGTRVREPVGSVADREAAVLADFGVPVGAELRLPRGIRARGTRRALRSRPADVHVQAEGRDVWLRFALPAGSYATVLLEEVFGPLRVDRGASTVESAAATVGDQGYARRPREDAPR